VNVDHPNQRGSVEHYKVFIQKWQILVRGKAAQGFSPLAQQRRVEDGLFTSPRRKPAENAASGQRCHL
jgi:hypothetical protein